MSRRPRHRHQPSLLRQDAKWLRACSCGWKTRAYAKPETSFEKMRTHLDGARQLRVVSQ